MIAYVISNHRNFLHPRDYDISKTHLAKTVSHLDEHGWNYEIVDAVDGHSIDDSDWESRNIRLSGLGTIGKRPGAQGCSLSHFDLWRSCREPMVILEHDAEVTAPFPDEFDWNLGICKLWKMTAFKTKSDTVGKWSRGTWAYTITPAQAERLIKYTELHGVQAADKQIGSNVVDFYHYHEDLVIHGPATKRSTIGYKHP